MHSPMDFPNERRKPFIFPPLSTCSSKSHHQKSVMLSYSLCGNLVVASLFIVEFRSRPVCILYECHKENILL